MKYFSRPWQEVVWKISYINMIMLLATIPVYESEYDENGKKKKKVEKVVDFGNDINSLANFINNQQ